MANTTLFFMVSNGGSILDEKYVGGVTRVWETKTGNMRNVLALKEVVQKLSGGDPEIKIFFEVVNEEGLGLLRPVQTHADASALMDIDMDVPYMNIYVIPTKEVKTQLNAARQPVSEVVSGDVSYYNVHT